LTVLVTGGAGYIGSQTVLACVEAGEPVIVLDDLSTGFSWAVPPEVVLVRGQTNDMALVSRLVADYGIKEIVHFAAATVVPDSVRDPLRYYLNNTSSSRSLIDAAVRGGVERFIFSSTAAVYGEPRSVPIAEDAPLDPISPYGWSKLMTEVMLRDAATAHGLRYVALRYFNVAGADPRLRTGQSTAGATHLIKVAIQVALGLREQLDVFGTDYPTPDGTCIRDYVHVADVADAHIQALRYLRDDGDSVTLNCGYGRGSSVLEVVDAVQAASGTILPVRLSDRRPGDAAEVVAAAAQIRAVLGWVPKYAMLATIIDHALAWERQLIGRRLIDDGGDDS